MAAAPAIVRFVGGSVPDALATTERMYQITLAENPAMQIPILGFRGLPTGIDVLAVARTGWLPQINTGMAGRVAGTGQWARGWQPLQQCFEQALAALAQEARAGLNRRQPRVSAPLRTRTASRATSSSSWSPNSCRRQSHKGRAARGRSARAARPASGCPRRWAPRPSFDQAVGVEEQRVAGRQVQLVVDPVVGRRHAEQASGPAFQPRRAVGARQDRGGGRRWTSAG